MATIVALEDVKDRVEVSGSPGSEIRRTFFIEPPRGTRLPQAFLVEYSPGRELVTHYHDADEFQIVVAGDGTFGRHAVRPYAVHFARAYTPYGPIVAGDHGLAFLTLRAQRDSAGPQKLPEKRAALDQVTWRRPFQVSQALDLEPSTGIAPLERFAEASGPRAWTVHVPADGVVELPDAAGSGGQYAAVLAGAIRVEARVLQAPVVAFVADDAQPFALHAGSAGATLLVLNFPLPQTAPQDTRQALVSAS